GYCPQEPALFDLLPPAEHLAVFAGGQAEAATEGRELLASLGVPLQARTLVRDLSGGARQKLSLALALLGQPGLLLLDEPYQGFDQGSYLDFWHHAGAWRRQGRAAVVVTHLPTALDRAARVPRAANPAEAGRRDCPPGWPRPPPPPPIPWPADAPPWRCSPCCRWPSMARYTGTPRTPSPSAGWRRRSPPAARRSSRCSRPAPPTSGSPPPGTRPPSSSPGGRSCS